MKKTLWISLTLISLWAYSASADLDVVREVIIAPKNARVMANIGPVNQSSNVRLAKAVVDIHAGPLPARNLPVHITVHAVFKLVNESSNKLELTVGFPVSNSKYSSFEFKCRIQAASAPHSLSKTSAGVL